MSHFEDLLRRVEHEIQRIRQRHASIYRETPGVRKAVAHWTLTGDALHWHIALEGVIEPDVDVEIETQAIIVRARSQDVPPRLWLGVLPVPPGFDIRRPRIRCDSGYLELQVLRVEGKALR